jgi:hypothetical protein
LVCRFWHWDRTLVLPPSNSSAMKKAYSPTQRTAGAITAAQRHCKRNTNPVFGDFTTVQSRMAATSEVAPYGLNLRYLENHRPIRQVQLTKRSSVRQWASFRTQKTARVTTAVTRTWDLSVTSASWGLVTTILKTTSAPLGFANNSWLLPLTLIHESHKAFFWHDDTPHLQYLRFYKAECIQIKSSWIWQCVVGRGILDVSKNRSAFAFKVHQSKYSGHIRSTSWTDLPSRYGHLDTSEPWELLR